MPVYTKHPEYIDAMPKWKRVRDAVQGVDAVKGAGEVYLPKLEGHSAAEYKAYLMRANWFGATARTMDSLHGLIFRKSAVVKAAQALVDDVTMTGKSAAEFASDIAREILEVGRVGILVDHARADTVVSNAAMAASLGLRPYITSYCAENIINWRTARINGKMEFTLVVLEESVEVERVDGFEVEIKTQYRVLRLADGVYKQQIWRKTDGDGGDWSVFDENTPMMNGRPMSSIPFQIVTPEQVSTEVVEPLLLDLADINFSHYRSSGDLEHGAHFTGLPTAVVSGYQKTDKNEVLSIGSMQAWVFPDPATKAEYLEFQGQGLGTIEKLLDRKEAQMAQMGARMLTEQKSQVESAKALEIRSSGEMSILGGIAIVVGRAMTNALKMASEWMGESKDVSCLVNTDFAIASIDSQQIMALVGAWQSGAISHKTLFWNLQQGEAIAADVDFEMEQSLIEAEGPSPMAQMVAAPAPAAPAGDKTKTPAE